MALDSTTMLDVQPMPRGVPTGHCCPLCGAPYLSGQLISGVARSDAPPPDAEGKRRTEHEYFEGHYTCVLQALGPEETLRAIQEGRLPLFDPKMLIDGCLPPELGGL